YDMWVIDLTGRKTPYSLTNGWGRENNTVLRILKSDYDSKRIDPKRNMLLETVNTESLDQGVYEWSPSRKLRKLMEGPYALSFRALSQDRKYCLFIRQGYSEFRDIWWSKADFANPVKITEANPQQKDYHWGSVKLVEWVNYEGKRNRGLLYLPDNYDSSKTYPVIVNFYETHTGELHISPIPTLSSAMINVVTYVSNGYVVFMPDVHFTTGAPGESCYNAVVSGTQMLIDKGIADKNRIGIQGHSWSGYQVAYLVTRTNMFRCANPGAAVSSMVSAYTGIRTGSGMPRMFMYEETQSRMGKTLWDDPEMYIKNSPIFYADKIQTPLLIFHCDGDEAVPYSEGLNLFLAMRRLHKPAWLLNYKGDKHFLYNKAAEIDWTIRLQQFFDYYLKDAPMPRWMKEGINVNERGVDQKYDLVK
ncbi:MAG: alpha/beta hydrolase family protein, partial [Butyricimonas faecihominis]